MGVGFMSLGACLITDAAWWKYFIAGVVIFAGVFGAETEWSDTITALQQEDAKIASLVFETIDKSKGDENNAEN